MLQILFHYSVALAAAVGKSGVSVTSLYGSSVFFSLDAFNMVFMSLLFCSFTVMGLGVSFYLSSSGLMLSESEHSYLSSVLKNSISLSLAYSLKSSSWIPIKHLSSVFFYPISHKYFFTVTISLSLSPMFWLISWVLSSILPIPFLTMTNLLSYPLCF